MRHDASRRVAMRHRRDVSRRDKVSRHDASWFVTQCVTTPHDASRCGTVAMCLDAKRCHHASRRVMVCHDASQAGHSASRRLTTRRDAAPSRRVSTRQGVTSRRVMVCHTMRHDASRCVAMSRRVAGGPQCVTTPHDASRCGTVATCLDAILPVAGPRLREMHGGQPGEGSRQNACAFVPRAHSCCSWTDRALLTLP